MLDEIPGARGRAERGELCFGTADSYLLFRLTGGAVHATDCSNAAALEGSIFVTGAAVQWLRDGLGIIRDAAETDALARSVPDNGGVYRVPAFTETPALGAACLAGLTTGLFKTTEAIAASRRAERRFEPVLSEDRREALYAGWKQAVARACLGTSPGNFPLTGS